MRPVPTRLFVALAWVGLLPAVLSLLGTGFVRTLWGFDLALVVLGGLDYWLAPGLTALEAARHVPSVLSSGRWTPVTLRLERRSPRRLRGEVRDTPPAAAEANGHRQRFDLGRRAPAACLRYELKPTVRGDAHFDDLFVRLTGPLGLCAAQGRLPLPRTVKIYPDLTVLSRDALALARAADAPSRRAQRRPAEAGEFESLRDYRPGDDYRSMDWKATARRAKPIVRTREPERSQPVLVLVDCGRHMTGRIGERLKLDYAVDAALRLAKASLDLGDQVGLIAFAGAVKARVPPRRGPLALRLITTALYGVEATFEESDYAAALALASSAQHRRALVVLLTDLQDPSTSALLVQRTVALRPRHLPVVVSLKDEDVARAARSMPKAPHDAYVRHVALRLEEDFRLTTAVLRNAGALALRVPPAGFGAAAVNEYLHVKTRGLL